MNFKFLSFFLFIAILFSAVSCAQNDKKSKHITTDIDSLVLLYPDSVPLLIQHGNKMLEEYQFERALNDGAKAFRLDSNNLEARLLYANVIYFEKTN
jgi:hypothetical protein